jgi:hypothetical protein
LRLLCGSWEAVVPMPREKLKVEVPLRVRVLMRGIAAKYPVVAKKSL